LDGLGALFGGVGFICGRPRNWGYASVPAVVAVVLTGLFGAALVSLSVWASGKILDPSSGTAAEVGLWILRVVFSLVAILLAGLLGLTLAQPVSGFALDELSRRQERELAQGREWPEAPGAFFRSLRVTFFGLGFGVLTVLSLSVITFFIPIAGVVTIPLKFYVTALVVAWDLLDYPLGLRGLGVRARIRWFTEHLPSVSGLGLAAGALLLIPGLGLLLLPIGVAGATRLVVLSEKSAP
jgi:CysZ protein